MRRLAALATASLAVLALAGCIVAPSAPAPGAGGDPALASGFPENMVSHGVLQTDEGVALTAVADETPIETTNVGDRVLVVAYVDLLCPYCGDFEAANGAALAEAVAAGEVALEVHPVAFLDRLSQGTEYSTRAANLVAAVASLHPDAVPEVLRLLWEQQPAENTTGLSDDELLAIAAQAGATSETLTAAVESVAFRPFVVASTDYAVQSAGVGGTPTVLVDGEQYTGQPADGAAFQALLDSAIGG